jgi:hypothetical protein
MAPPKDALIYDSQTGQFIDPNEVDPNDPDYEIVPYEQPSTLENVGNFLGYTIGGVTKRALGGLNMVGDALGASDTAFDNEIERAYQEQVERQEARRRLLNLDDGSTRAAAVDFASTALGAVPEFILSGGPLGFIAYQGLAGAGDKYSQDGSDNLSAGAISAGSTALANIPLIKPLKEATTTFRALNRAGISGLVGNVLDQPGQTVADRKFQIDRGENPQENFITDMVQRLPEAAIGGYAFGAGAAGGQLLKQRVLGKPSSRTLDSEAANKTADEIIQEFEEMGGPVDGPPPGGDGAGELSDIPGPLELPEPQLRLPPPQLKLPGTGREYTAAGDPFGDYPTRLLNIPDSNLGLPAPEQRLGLPQPSRFNDVRLTPELAPFADSPMQEPINPYLLAQNQLPAPDRGPELLGIPGPEGISFLPDGTPTSSDTELLQAYIDRNRPPAPKQRPLTPEMRLDNTIRSLFSSPQATRDIIDRANRISQIMDLSSGKRSINQPLVDPSGQMFGDSYQPFIPRENFNGADRVQAPKVSETKVLKGEFPEPAKEVQKAVQKQVVEQPESQLQKKNSEQILRDLPITEVELARIVDDPEIPQFKRKGTELLQGVYDRFPLNPITLYERLTGTLAIGSGRHRRNLANASGEVTIPSQIIREADGFTPKDIQRIDAELNIRDGKGETQDFANYFRLIPESELSSVEIQRRGLLNDSQGRAGYIIGRKAAPDVFDLHWNNKISDDQAVAITEIAGNDPDFAQAGLHLALKNHHPDDIRLALQSLKRSVAAQEVPKPQQGGLFDGTPTGLVLERQALAGKLARQKQTSLAQSRITLEKILKNPALAKQQKLDKGLQIDVTDANQVKQKIAELKAEEAKYNIEGMTKATADSLYNEIVAQEAQQASAKARSRRPRVSGQSGFVDIPQAIVDLKKFSGEKVGDFWDYITNGPKGVDIPLTAGEKFLGNSFSGAVRRQISFVRTIKRKVPETATALEAERIYNNKRNEIASKARAILDPYLKLPKKLQQPIDELAISSRIAADKYFKEYKTRMPELTEQQLKARGLSPEQITAFKSVRQFANESLNDMGRAMMAQIESMKLSPENKVIAQTNVLDYVNSLKGNHYVPLMRPPGRYAVRVEGPDEATEYYSVHQSKAEAIARKQELQSQGLLNAKVKELSRERMENVAGLPLDLQIVLDDVFPISAADRQGGKEASGGFRMHLLKARMIPGYETNLSVALSDYAIGLANYAARAHGEVQFQRGMTELGGGKPAVSNTLNTWWKDVKKGQNSAVSTALRAGNVFYLMGVPASGIINTTQTFTTTHAALASKNLYGIKGAPKALTKAISEGFAYMNAVRNETLDAYAAKNPERAAAIQRGLEQGVLDAQAFGELQNFRKGLVEPVSVVDFLMKTFTIPERANRVIAFMAGFDAARLKLGYDFETSARYAEEFVNKTQFDQSWANTPELFRKMGGVGRVMMQFKFFTGNYLSFIRDALEQKDFGVAAVSLGTMFSVAGALGLPGAGAAIDIIDAYFDTNTRQNVRNLIGNKAASDALLYGLSTTLGVSGAGAGLGDAIPSIDQDPFRTTMKFLGGPLADLPFRYKKAYDAYKKDAPWVAAAGAVPRVLRGPIKAAELATTGNVRTPEGDEILPPGSDTAKNIAQMGLGFTPSDYMSFYEKRTNRYKLERQARDNDDINLRFAKALKAGDNERMDEIIQESLDSFEKEPQFWKRLDTTSIKRFLLPENLRALMKAPKEVRPGLAEIEESFAEE